MSITSTVRDVLLRNLYSNKELIVFTKGEEWFKNRVEQIHLQYKSLEERTTMFGLPCSPNQNLQTNIVLWEYENKYTPELIKKAQRKIKKDLSNT